jgi:hypothetical protein
LSCSASSISGSLKRHHCGMKFSRNIVSSKGRASLLAFRCKRRHQSNRVSSRHDTVYLVKELAFARSLAPSFTSSPPVSDQTS